MAGRRDARGAVHVQAHVVAASGCALAGVETHPDADRAIRRPRRRGDGPLDLDDRRDRVLRRLEDRERTVALVVDLDAAVSGQSAAQDLEVPFEDGSVSLAERVEEPRRPFDIGEQERDGPGGQLVGRHRADGSRAAR